MSFLNSAVLCAALVTLSGISLGAENAGKAPAAAGEIETVLGIISKTAKGVLILKPADDRNFGSKLAGMGKKSYTLQATGTSLTKLSALADKKAVVQVTGLKNGTTLTVKSFSEK